MCSISIMFTANHHKTIPSKYTPNILKKMSSWKYTFIQKEPVKSLNLKLGPKKMYAFS